MTRVRFLTDDRYGLWRAGDEAESLGRESSSPEAPPVFLFKLRGETIALTSPWTRGLVADLAKPDCRFCHGKPVHNASHWIGGPRRVVPCPRCGGVA